MRKRECRGNENALSHTSRPLPQGAFSYVFTEATPGLTSTVLELPEVCRTGEGIKATQSATVQVRAVVAPAGAPLIGTLCTSLPLVISCLSGGACRSSPLPSVLSSCRLPPFPPPRTPSLHTCRVHIALSSAPPSTNPLPPFAGARQLH